MSRAVKATLTLRCRVFSSRTHLPSAQFHGSAYEKQRIGAYGSGNFSAYITSSIFYVLAENFCLCPGEFLVTRHSTLNTASTEIRCLHISRRMVIKSTESGGKQSHEIGPKMDLGCAIEGLRFSMCNSNSSRCPCGLDRHHIFTCNLTL